jgi:hypothetical protein
VGRRRIVGKPAIRQRAEFVRIPTGLEQVFENVAPFHFALSPGKPVSTDSQQLAIPGLKLHQPLPDVAPLWLVLSTG